ncbi:hypothetical protein RVR_9689 [Actinacidiphila reveromycinica]|uniref:HTH luxR-type domain-containing protein n=1 Tax=Actinacidiphila reveromycinica TaxID=659352 RepID=A0A7U3V033_9ACTN|nr:helix-turn-helix transcriptional regulator [Streptomyces sp. SN-593]BBB02009.1 hypothetical protein RVR_9689 [Streptomyces sp. SN-593]
MRVRSTPLDLIDAPTDNDLDETERTIATLLRTGMTDDQIARRMSITRRTVQRRIRSLMDRRGARSRFELGMHLAPLIENALPDSLARLR